jgi:predicted metalloprotease with PDZ domain
MSDELWLAEGFTQYYGPLMLSRTGIANLQTTAWTFRSYAASAMQNPARAIRSAVEMSRMGAFTDRSTLEDRTNWSNTVLSYYELGAAIAMSLDLSLRERTGGHVTLDDFMQAMWRTHGKPGSSREGYVDHPYSERDAQARLAEVSGDPAFAADFFRRYVDGKETPDFVSLFRRAGLVLRKQFPGRASWGDVKIDFRSSGARVTTVPPSTSPAYAAGVDVDDQVRSLDGRTISSGADISAVLRQRRPGDRIPIVFADRTGMVIDSTITLVEDDTLELVPVESAGGALTPEERAFRESWLGVR